MVDSAKFVVSQDIKTVVSPNFRHPLAVSLKLYPQQLDELHLLDLEIWDQKYSLGLALEWWMD